MIFEVVEMSEWHVIYDDEEDNWMVRRANAARATSKHNSKDEAVERAKEAADNQQRSEEDPNKVYVHEMNEGENLKPVQKEFTYPRTAT